MKTKFKLKFACFLSGRRILPGIYETSDKEEIKVLEATKYVEKVDTRAESVILAEAQKKKAKELLDKNLKDISECKSLEILEGFDATDNNLKKVIADKKSELEELKKKEDKSGDNGDNGDNGDDGDALTREELMIEYKKLSGKDAPKNIGYDTLVKKIEEFNKPKTT